LSVQNELVSAALQIVQDPEKAGVLLQTGRLQLLSELENPGTAAGLARKLGVPRQKLNYHLHELEREGFLELVEERRKGNCMERVVRASARSYLIGPQAMGRLGETPAEAVDRFSAAYLIATAARVIRELANLAIKARRAAKRVATLTLDAEIRFASAESRNAFAEELTGAFAALAAKYHDEHSPGGRRFRLIAAVYPSPDPQNIEPDKESVNVD
jgi:DNA-binding transcriptional ArsR family regulator